MKIAVSAAASPGRRSSLIAANAVIEMHGAITIHTINQALDTGEDVDNG